ncbi:MAG: hypothetical protein ACO1OC_11315 [Tuberibacillus sp.]
MIVIPVTRLFPQAAVHHQRRALGNVLHDLIIDYKFNEGDDAFYDPKIDFHIKDALGRSLSLDSFIESLLNEVDAKR